MVSYVKKEKTEKAMGIAFIYKEKMKHQLQKHIVLLIFHIKEMN